MKLLLVYFFRSYHLSARSVLFKRALYCFLLFKCAYWLWHYTSLFGADSIIYRQEGHTNFLKDLAYVLYNNKSDLLPLYFIIAVAALSGIMLYRQKNNLGIDLAIWLLAENLHYSVYATLTGGDYLLNQFLFFNIFIAIDAGDSRGKYKDVYVCLHNAAVAAVIMQVCIVYVVAAISKLMDPEWISGEAVRRVNEVTHFSLGLARAENWESFHRISNYLVIAYQLAFPLLVFINRLKVPLLLLGVIMHVYISLVMGLLAFGVLMVLSYIYFWPSRRSAVQI